MKNSRDEREEDYWMRVALSGCLAGLVLVLCLIVVGNFDLPVRGTTAARVGAGARAQTAQADRAVNLHRPLATGVALYRDTPFVTDEGGNAPGPLLQ